MKGRVGFYRVGFFSYSGGTGCTTLALATAFQFAQTKEPTTLLELCYAKSAINALCVTTPKLHLSTILTEKRPPTEWAVWHGIRLIPMDYDYVRASVTIDDFEGFLESIGGHLVVDGKFFHSFYPSVAAHLDTVFAVADARRWDTVVNAQYAQSKLGALVLLNFYGPLQRAALLGVPRALTLPPTRDPQVKGPLGKIIYQYLMSRE